MPLVSHFTWGRLNTLKIKALIFLSASTLLTFLLSGCGGSAGNATVTPSHPANPVTRTYTISTQAGEGTSFSTANATVETSKSATFSVSLSAGYKNLRVVGCNVDVTKTEPGTYSITTPAALADCTLLATATKATSTDQNTITFNAKEGVAFSHPPSTLVRKGTYIQVDVVLKPGYKNLHVTGCGIDFSWPNSSTYGFAFHPQADCTLTGEASVLPVGEGPYNFHGVGQSSTASIANSNASFEVEARVSGQFSQLLAHVYDSWLDGATKINAIRKIPMTNRGDGLYTATITIPETAKLYKYAGQQGSLSVGIHAINSTGQEIHPGANSVKGNMIAHSVIDPKLGAPEMTSCGPHASRNAHIVNVVAEFSNVEALHEALRSCVDTSMIDFIMRFPVGAYSQHQWSHAGITQNETEGIGMRIFSNTPMDFPRLRAYQTIGMHMLDCGSVVCLHEVMHTWGFYLKKEGIDLTGGSYEHLGTSNMDGFLGSPPYLHINADGSATIDDSARPRLGRYDPLEQYLAGWRDANEVPPRYFAINQTQTIRQGTVIPKSELQLASPEWIASQFGPRKTTNGTPFQKDFNMVMVILSNKPLTKAEVAHFSLISQHFEGTSAPENIMAPNKVEMLTPPSFAYATEGRARIRTRVIPKP